MRAEYSDNLHHSSFIIVVMLFRLVIAELRHRPGRAAFLLAGYSLGVSVMVVLLAVGEAMLEQARDQALVGGGDVVVVPSGISPDMLRAGGATSLFLGIDQARFIQRSVLESARGREEFGVVAASPVLDDKLVEITTRSGSFPAVAAGEIPSRSRAAGAAPDLLAGTWTDSRRDRLWTSPNRDELFREIDRFHLPTGAGRDSTWAEWHYFNVVLAPDRWVYVTLMVAGEVGVPGRWGGRVLLTVRGSDGRHRSLTRDVGGESVRFDTAGADLRIGQAGTVVQENGVYRIVASAGGERVDLELRPAAGRYFPPTELGGTGLVSGYVVPALYAEASGTVCLPRCEPVRGAQAYHDHNWGVWRDVSWEWGAASTPRLSLLYGVVRGEDAPETAASRGVFAYLVDERGVRGLYRPSEIQVPETQLIREGGRDIRIPKRLRFEDARRGFLVDIEVASAHVTDMRRERRRYFVQMRGVAAVSTRGADPQPLPGFFETYVD
ncbi:MAG: hypothetical protein KY464_02900 [Gemmatimonadetes bacterium]|nr:hypothetical protein [Gemmatimonadota bacterium]